METFDLLTKFSLKTVSILVFGIQIGINELNYIIIILLIDLTLGERISIYKEFGRLQDTEKDKD